MASLVSRDRPVYLVDLHCYKPPEELRVKKEDVVQLGNTSKVWDQETLDFLDRIFDRSGLSADGTYLPRAIHPKYVLAEGRAPRTDLKSAAEEAHMTLTGAAEGLLERTGMSPHDIDVVVTTCSIYCPVPSLPSLIVNHFKMRPSTETYSLSGMGCANGVVAVSLIRDLLQAQPNINIMFLTTEVTTPAYYPGQDRHRLVTNMLFRMGAAAMLFSNKASLAGQAKYDLLYNHRTHIAANDDAYRAIWYGPDDQGIRGVYLGKNVVNEAGAALTKVMTRLAPRELTNFMFQCQQLLNSSYHHYARPHWARRIVTWRQLGEYAVHTLKGRLAGHGKQRKGGGERYTPCFSECLDHVIIHSGGAKILDGIGKGLRLHSAHLAPSYAVLRDYGNVSASSTWYTLAHIETVGGLRRGDRVMQVGVGSGIKCGVNLWRARRDICDLHPAWEHLLTPAEAACRRRELAVRVSLSGHARTHLWLRVVFFVLMAFLAGAMHLLMMHVTPVEEL